MFAGRISEDNLRGSLDLALQQVNLQLEEAEVKYRVAAGAGRELKAKEPIFLEIEQDGVKTAIGITHFAKLTESFELAPFQETARTVDELAASILKATKIYEAAKNNPDVLITVAGTPFFKNGRNVEIREGILFVEGMQITYNGHPLEAKRLCGEEGLQFVRLDNGDFEVKNPIDQRLGKGIFFKKDTGEIYRK